MGHTIEVDRRWVNDGAEQIYRWVCSCGRKAKGWVCYPGHAEAAGRRHAEQIGAQ